MNVTSFSTIEADIEIDLTEELPATPFRIVVGHELFLHLDIAEAKKMHYELTTALETYEPPK